MSYKNTILILSMVLTLGIGPGRSAQSSLLDLALNGSAATEISRVEVLRINPWVMRVVAVRPWDVGATAAAEAIVRDRDSFGMTSFTAELKQLSVSDEGCGDMTYTYDTFPVAWAIQMYNSTNVSIGSIYLTESGTCILVGRKIYTMDPRLLVFLRRQFNFLNF
jgi:hypothetical protein